MNFPAGLLAPLVANALPELRKNPVEFGLRVGAGVAKSLPLAGGGIGDYRTVAVAFREAASLLEDAARGTGIESSAARATIQSYGL